MESATERAMAVINAAAAGTGGVSTADKTISSNAQKMIKVFKSDFDAKYNIVDMQTPTNAFMSGQYKRSYAYYTLRSRLPVVLTNVIDAMTKGKNTLTEQFSESSREELKIIIGLISRLKYELQTDKPFQYFSNVEVDREVWNDFLKRLPEGERTFYKTRWIYAECYMYRKLYSFVENSVYFKKFDYFAKAKELALNSCMDDILKLTELTRRTEKSLETFSMLLKFDLWSNRNDFTPDPENELRFNSELLNNVSAADSSILVNNAAEIWACLENKTQKNQQVDFITDNVGFELFADLILGEYIIEKGLANKVNFHVKAHPWFVSNVTASDFHWTVKHLSAHADYMISLIGKKFSQFFDEGKFELAPTSHFWTAPHAFSSMPEIAPELYATLQQSKLIIFKGDLNYRKLLSDVCWEATQDIKACLHGFVPSCLCTIRTIKAEVICGLPQSLLDDLSQKDPQWMVSGNYGIIQYVDGESSFGY